MPRASLLFALFLLFPLSHSLTLSVRAPIELSNQGDLSYYADLTLNGRVFKVLVDTGRYAFFAA
jgi:predicted aspartyl protease